MRYSDIYSGALITALGLFLIFVVVPDQISGSSDYGIAPDVFPLTILWLMTGLSATLLAIRLARRSKLDGAPAMSSNSWLFILGASLFLALSFLAIQYLGFRIGGAAILGILMALLGERFHKVRLVAVSVITPLIIFHIFWNIFYVPLP